MPHHELDDPIPNLTLPYNPPPTAANILKTLKTNYTSPSAALKPIASEYHPVTPDWATWQRAYITAPRPLLVYLHHRTPLVLSDLARDPHYVALLQALYTYGEGRHDPSPKVTTTKPTDVPLEVYSIEHYLLGRVGRVGRVRQGKGWRPLTERRLPSPFHYRLTHDHLPMLNHLMEWHKARIERARDLLDIVDHYFNATREQSLDDLFPPYKKIPHGLAPSP